MLVGGLGFLIVRSRCKKHRASAQVAAAALPQGAAKTLGHSAEEMQRKMEAKLAEHAAQQAETSGRGADEAALPVVATKKTEVLEQTHCGRDEEGPVGDGAGSEDLAQW